MGAVTKNTIRLYTENDAIALATFVRSGDVSALELVDTAIDLIDTVDDQLNSVTIRSFDLARDIAKLPMRDGIFSGVPFLLKDLASFWSGIPCTAGFGYRRDFVPSTDSGFAARMRAGGLIPLGRTNVPEAGWSLSTEPASYGPTHNPWRLGISPGGSSGGSGAAVAARLVPMAEASDAAGSIRFPASCCGLVGLKPSRGRVSFGPAMIDLLFGNIYVSAVTRTVRDTAAFLDTVAGNEPGDLYLPRKPSNGWLAGIGNTHCRRRIGVAIDAPWGTPTHPAVREVVEDAAATLKAMGHDVQPHEIKTDLYGAWQNYTKLIGVFLVQEFAMVASLVRQEPEEGDIPNIIRLLLERGRNTSGAEVMDALAALQTAARELTIELQPYDAFLTPTLTQPPRPLGHWDMGGTDLDAYHEQWTDGAFLPGFNYSGLPAISLPFALAPDGLPIGIQLAGRYADELTLLQIGAELENAVNWAARRAPLAAGAVYQAELVRGVT